MGNDLKSDSEQVLSSMSHRVVNTSENIDFCLKRSGTINTYYS